MKVYLALFVMCCKLVITAFSQPMSGNYTIGSVNSDYQTINDAITALNNNGVNSSVTFDINPGTYYEELNIGYIQGASSVNTITFQSTTLDSSDVIVSNPSGSSTIGNHTLRLVSAHHLIFQHLTFQRTGSQLYALVVEITNKSENIKFYRNRFIAPPTTQAAIYKSVVYGSNNHTQSNIIFDGNRFENGSYGIWLLGIGQHIGALDSGNEIINNEFVDQHYVAIMLSYQAAPIVMGNTIQSASTTNGFGINLFFCDNGMDVSKNKINVINGKGIYVNNTSVFGIPQNLISNNFVAVGGGGVAEGILLDNAKSVNLFYNSIHLYNTNLSSVCLKINGFICQNNNLLNNIMVNSGGGYSIYVADNTNVPFTLSDHNNFLTSGTNIGYWQSLGDQQTLIDYQTASGMEINTVSIDPGFVSNVDLHCTNPLMSKLGMPVLHTSTPVAYDIDGDIRSTVAPDIGADEYSVIDLAMVYVDSIYGLCEAGKPNIMVKIANVHPVAFDDTVMVGYQFSGQQSVIDNYFLQIPANDTVTIKLTTGNPLPQTGQYSLVAFLNHPDDHINSNDTITVNAFIDDPIVIDLGPDISVCNNEIKTINVDSTFNKYLWSDSSSYHYLNIYGENFLPGVYNIWLRVENEKGCSKYDTVQVIIEQHPQPKISADPSFVGLVGNDSTTIICNKNITVFRCGDYQSYLWHNGSKDSIFVLNPGFLPVGNYMFHVTVTASNGCVNSDTLWFFADDCIGIDQINESVDVKVFPNPSDDGLFIIKSDDLTTKATLRIFNIYGKELKIKNKDLKSDGILYIDLSMFPKGIYLLNVSVDGQSITKQLITI